MLILFNQSGWQEVASGLATGPAFIGRVGDPTASAAVEGCASTICGSLLVTCSTLFAIGTAAGAVSVLADGGECAAVDGRTTVSISCSESMVDGTTTGDFP